MSKYNRGEIWMVDLGYAAKVRPCLIISIPSEDSDRVLVSLVPHTTSVRGTQFEVVINVNFLRSGAFDVQNLITIPEAKLIRKLGALNQNQLTAVEDTIKIWLGL